MINKDCFTKPSHCYCDEPEKIENYDKAMADTEKVWICHHRLESCFTVEFLKKMGLYFHQPAEALVFVENEKEHQSYKHAGHKNSHKAISTFWKGKNRAKPYGIALGFEQGLWAGSPGHINTGGLCLPMLLGEQAMQGDVGKVRVSEVGIAVEEGFLGGFDDGVVVVG